MGIKQDVFGLEQIYRLQVEGQWSTRGDVWTTPSPFITIQGTDFGYMAGGFAGSYPSPSTVVDRIDYSNDTATASAKGPLTAGASYTTGVASVTHGYVLGGRAAAHLSTVNRIDFANDTANSLLRGPLSQTRYRSHAATGNKDFGYIGGGQAGGPSTASSVDRVDYSNDSATSVVKGPLTSIRYLLSATGNSNFGYFGGGNPSSNLSKVDRIDYANDTATASPKGNLSLGRRKLAATGTADFGYFASGTTPNNTVVDRVDYSNDTATASPKGPTAYQTSNPGSASSVTHGYFGGGTPGPLSSVQRIDYANDTATATIKGPLTQARWGLAGMSSRDSGFPASLVNPASAVRENVRSVGGDFGYFAGGQTLSPQVSTINRVDFSNDTATASPKGALSGAKKGLAAVGNGEFGYFAGGQSPYMSTVDRIDYESDTTTAVVKGPLVTILGYHGAAGNKDFGYTFGGRDSGFPGNHSISSVYRIDYSNDTAAALAKGPLTERKYNNAGTGNQDFGYLGGGNNYSGGARSSIERIDYSNDTEIALVKGKLPNTRSHNAGTGNASFGYFGGGRGAPSSPSLPKSSVDRIDYSNDTATASPKGPLNTINTNLGATGNASFGYFGGGITPSATSKVDRVDYSNDTATTSPRGPLSSVVSQMGSVSSREYNNPLKGPGNLEVPVAFGPFIGTQPQVGFNNGYFAGGTQPGNSPSFPSSLIYSSVARIDYSNDTTMVPARASLDAERYSAAGTGSSNFGYLGGGSPGGQQSTVSRIDYGNDTATPVTKGPLANEVNNAQATGNNNFGYVNGGSGWNPSVGPVYFSSSSRIAYGNDTATALVKGNLTRPLRQAGATGNQSFGYFGGGTIAPPSPRVSSVDRIDYSNDTATGVTKGPLTVRRREIGATGNASFGYFGGGYNSIPGGNNWISTIDRIDYSNDTATASPKGPLSRTRGFGCATGDSSFGYFGGGEGNNNENLSALDRLDYSNDTATTVDKGPLSYSLRNSAASSSLANANPPFSPSIVNYAAGTYATPHFGYFGGGRNNPSSPISSVDRIDYSNDTATALAKGSLSAARHNLAATSSSTHGYFGGGGPLPSSHISTIDRIDYLNDTSTASPKGPLSAAKTTLTATGNASFGYFAGGYIVTPAASFSSKIDRLDYSNDTATTVAKGPLSATQRSMGATGNQDFGYFGGGDPALSKVDRIDYSNDTATASPKGTLSITRQYLAASGNASFGYFGGGGTPGGGRSSVDRVDYSNDTATAAAKGPLKTARESLGATGSSSFGYFAGGDIPANSNYSDIDRIDYSNDTATASSKGPLTAFRRFHAAASARANAFGPILGPSVVSNAAAIAGSFNPTQFGYFGGGNNPALNPTPQLSTVDRIDYSNDTATASTRGPLSLARWYLGATGNSFFGYFGGGNGGSISTVDRVDYSNDTATAVAKGPLSSSRYGKATGNSSFGYFGGGYNGSSRESTVDRIDYSNDTATASPKGPLSSGKTEPGATGNQNFGYFAGGYTGSRVSTIDRIDYSNDTATASVRGPLSQSKSHVGAIGNQNFGYFAGGLPGPLSTVDRVDYSNDTVTASPKGPLGAARDAFQGTGNVSFGYFGGGYTGSYISTVERVDYSNDTATAVEKGTLSARRFGHAATSAAANSNPQ